MTRAEIQARVERLQRESLITCTDCRETYRIVELFIYPEALCRDNDWCDCKVGKAVFTTLVPRIKA